MKRRAVLKNLGLATGGMLLFPSCDFSDEKVSIILNKLQINSNEEALLKAMVDSILPEGDIPGGIAVKAHNFVWTYIDDCTSPQDQESFIANLKLFDTTSKSLLGKRFENAQENERITILEGFIKGDDETLKNFVETVKGLSVWCYMNSEYILTKEMPYRLIPGANSYEPCKTVDPTQRININA